MIRTYTDDQIEEFRAFYERHGAVRLPGLLDADTVRLTLEAIDRVAAQADDPAPPDSDLSFGRAPGRMTIRHIWRNDPHVRALMMSKELSDPLARIVGGRELRFWYDLTFIHEEADSGIEGEGTPWHHDISSFGFQGERLPSLWMALTSADESRSRLRFVDGSHKSAPGFYRPSARPAPDEPDGLLPLPDFESQIAAGEAAELTWNCEPGDAIVIHPYQVHGAKGNKGEAGAGRRVAITTRWLGDDVRFLPADYKKSLNAVEMPKSARRRLTIGCKPPDDCFPLVQSLSAT